MRSAVCRGEDRSAPGQRALRRLIPLLLAAALAAAAGAACAGASPEAPAIRIGILNTVGRLSSAQVFTPTADLLRRAFERCGHGVELTFHDIGSLMQAVERRELDFFIANPGFFAVAQSRWGAHHLATQQTRETDDPNRAMGGVFLVRSDRRDLVRVEDLRGRRAAAVASTGFGGYYVLLGEIERRGLVSGDPEKYFSEVRFAGYPMQKVIHDLLTNPAIDVALVRTCLLEEMSAQGQLDPKAVRVVGERPADASFRCRRSTDLYPGWVFAATPRASPGLSKLAGAVLLSSAPGPDGAQWSVANNFTAVDALYKTLEVGHYAYLRQFELKRFMAAYWPHVLLLMVLIAGGLVHAVKVERVVRERTASLEAALAEQKHLAKAAEDIRVRLDQMQKIAMMSMLSSMIAHELKQPIGVIANYVEGLRDWIRSKRCAAQADWTLLERGLDEIDGQNRRAAEIIDHVRSYAKTRSRTVEALVLGEFLRRTIESFRRFAGTSCRIEASPGALESAECIEGCRMELELVVINLLKNAVEAPPPGMSRRVEIRVGPPPDPECRDGAGICIANAGTLPDGIVERAFEPKMSGRESGLGLGLAIAAQIMEQEGGRLMLRQAAPGRVEAWMMWPKTLRNFKP